MLVLHVLGQVALVNSRIVTLVAVVAEALMHHPNVLLQAGLQHICTIVTTVGGEGSIGKELDGWGAGRVTI